MTVKEISRLIEWLRASGHTDAQIIACIQYIAQDNTRSTKKKPATVHNKD